MTKLYKVEITISYYVSSNSKDKDKLYSDSNFHGVCLENEVNFPDYISVEEVTSIDEITTQWKDASPYPYPNRYQNTDNRLCKNYLESSDNQLQSSS